MVNVPPDGWESAITETRDGVENARVDVAALLDRVGPPGAGLPGQVAEVRAVVAALATRVATLERRGVPAPGEPPTGPGPETSNDHDPTGGRGDR